MITRRMLLIDSIALDVLGVGFLIAGHVAIGLTLLALAAVACTAWALQTRRERSVV